MQYPSAAILLAVIGTGQAGRFAPTDSLRTAFTRDAYRATRLQLLNVAPLAVPDLPNDDQCAVVRGKEGGDG